MKKRILMTGNEAIAEAAIQAGCRFYAGYPITPQNEIPAYMAANMPKAGGIFIQSESEIAAINMVFGASAAGARAMTSSSSPGISLKQEGISYLAGCQLPSVIINIMRGGPGLGNIGPSQSDYFQATKGGGHGDYHIFVLAPASVQEAFDLTQTAFELADKYRMPAMILGDGILGQMMEPMAKPSALSDSEVPASAVAKPWALTGCKGREPNIIRSLLLKEGALEALNQELQARYSEIEKQEARWESFYTDDSEIILVAYGTTARIAKSAMNQLREQGKSVGLIRPITLWPFPKQAFSSIDKRKTQYLVVEMSCGQMVEDVRLAVNGRHPVDFFGRCGGGVPTEEEIIKKIEGLDQG